MNCGEFIEKKKNFKIHQKQITFQQYLILYVLQHCMNSNFEQKNSNPNLTAVSCFVSRNTEQGIIDKNALCWSGPFYGAGSLFLYEPQGSALSLCFL